MSCGYSRFNLVLTGVKSFAGNAAKLQSRHPQLC
jgi:hypothetical protein